MRIILRSLLCNLFQNEIINSTIDLVYAGFWMGQKDNTTAFQNLLMQDPYYIEDACGDTRSNVSGTQGSEKF